MKVQWKAFSQRRGIKIEEFQHMKYEEFSRWCEYRNVIPAEKTEFLGETPPAIVQTIETPVVEDVTFDEKLLKKKLKGDLQILCEDNGIDFEASWTKKKLVSALLELNN